MSERVPELSAAFGIEYDPPSEEHKRLLRTTRCFAGLMPGMTSNVQGQYWDEATTIVAKALQSAMSTPVTRIFADAWNKYRPFLKYGDPVRYPPNVASQESLLKHTINFTAKPQVRVLLNGELAGTIDFEAKLSITLEGGVLTIQAGKFTKLRPGKCRVTGTLKCEGALLTEVKSRELVLPDEIRLGDGIPIVPELTTVAGMP